MGIIVNQFGFANGSGVLADIVDGNVLTGWSPLSTDFGAYPDQFFATDRITPNFGKAFPALQFDLGQPRRIPQFLIKVASPLTLGPALLIGSTVSATSPADVLQVGDIVLDQYTAEQITSNKLLDVSVMRDQDIRRRYLRLLQRSNVRSIADVGHGPANSVTFDAGAGSWQVVSYSSKLTIETWGGGSSGGLHANAIDGGTTTAGVDSSWTQTSLGGSRAANAMGVPGGIGGTSSGANTLNITGGNGGTIDPNTVAPGHSGRGGDSPFGGVGGDAIYQVFEPGRNFYFGNPGASPGGGGGGLSVWYPVGDVAFFKSPGGGAGGYSKHVINRGDAAAQPGSFIAYSVGAGGVSVVGNGAGAPGRVRFSWT